MSGAAQDHQETLTTAAAAQDRIAALEAALAQAARSRHFFGSRDAIVGGHHPGPSFIGCDAPVCVQDAALLSAGDKAEAPLVTSEEYRAKSGDWGRD